jgi:hypothetical protein
MASAKTHAVVGAGVALLPDVMLLAFGWRRSWLLESHPLVRTHRWLHSPSGLITVALLAYGSHLLIDRHSRHREGPNA